MVSFLITFHFSSNFDYTIHVVLLSLTLGGES